MQPPVVLAAHEVQRAAVEPADDERALAGERAVDIAHREAVRTGADGEPRAAQVLRLHREQPIRDRHRVGASLVGEQLAGESGPEVSVH